MDKPPPWLRRHRSRSRDAKWSYPLDPSHPQHNPAHPANAQHRNCPQPSTALTERVQRDIERLRQEAEWGVKMRPSDPDWVADSHNAGVEIRKRLLRNPPQVLLERMPRNPSTLRYEQHESTFEKTKFMKYLLNLHDGEVRETYGFWRRIQEPLPNSKTWYNPQYPKDEALLSINRFLKRSNEKSEHFRRESWGFSLPRLMEEFGEKHTFDTVYELFSTLPIMVSKKKRGSFHS